MSRSDAQLRMADRLAHGKLAEVIIRYRRSGVAWAAITRLLFNEYGIEVSRDTLPVWAARLGIDDETIRAEAAS